MLMKEKLLIEIENQYHHVNFKVSLKDTIDWLKSKNLQDHICRYTIKNGDIIVTDLDGNHIDVGINGHPYQLKLSLSIVLKKYPQLETQFLFWKYDNLIGDIVNFPIFVVSNVPNDGSFNPLCFHDCLFEVPMFIDKSFNQINFEDKKKVAYARIGLTGINKDVFNKDTWFNHYKMKFALFSNMFPDKCDFKLFFVHENARKGHLGDMQDFIDKLPIYGQTYDQIDIHELWNDQLKVQINLLNEGNSSVSHARYLMALYNNGHIIRIGPSHYKGLIDLMVESCDYPLVNAVCDTPNTQFLNSIESLIDNNSNLKERRNFVMNHFSQDYLSTVIFEMIEIYNKFVKF